MDDIILDSPDLTIELHLATTGQRIGNMAVDQIVCYVLSFGMNFFIEIIGRQSYHTSLLGEKLIALFLQLLAMLFYFVVMENSFGKTVGKMITRTHVVNRDGEQPDFRTIVIRSLCRMIPFDALSFLGKAPGWHDSLSKTLVVQDGK